MKTAKKVFAILTELTLICCVFAGCDSNETPDTTENNSANANAGTEVYKIGIVQLVEHVALDAATEGFNKVLDVTEEIVKKEQPDNDYDYSQHGRCIESRQPSCYDE